MFFLCVLEIDLEIYLCTSLYLKIDFRYKDSTRLSGWMFAVTSKSGWPAWQEHTCSWKWQSGAGTFFHVAAVKPHTIAFLMQWNVNWALLLSSFYSNFKLHLELHSRLQWVTLAMSNLLRRHTPALHRHVVCFSYCISVPLCAILFCYVHNNCISPIPPT